MNHGLAVFSKNLEVKKAGQIAVGAESIQINEDRLNKVKCEVVDISGTKAGNVWETTLTLRLLMSYIYGAPILDVSRPHTTTQHSR